MQRVGEHRNQRLGLPPGIPCAKQIRSGVGGARFGAGSLPDRWLETVDRAAELRSLGERLATGEFDA